MALAIPAYYEKELMIVHCVDDILLLNMRYLFEYRNCLESVYIL